MSTSDELFTEEEKKKILKVKEGLINLINSTHAFTFVANKIDDEGNETTTELRLSEISTSNMVVTGGAIVSLFHNKPINDLDVFILKNEHTGHTDWTKAEMLMHRKVGRWQVRYNEDDYLKNEHIRMTAFNHDTRVQYILTDYSTREELLAHFDFIHCMANYHKGMLHITHDTYDAIMKKHLVVNGDNNVLPSRMSKYRSLGWKSPVEVAYEEPSLTLGEILQKALEKKAANIFNDALNDLKEI